MDINNFGIAIISAVKVLVAGAIVGIATGQLLIPNSNVPEVALGIAIIAAIYKYLEQTGWFDVGTASNIFLISNITAERPITIRERL